MKELENELNKILVKKLGLPESKTSLAIAKPVAERVGKVSRPGQVALDIITAVFQKLPQSVISQGEEAVKKYFSMLDFNDQMRFLMGAAASVLEEHK